MNQSRLNETPLPEQKVTIKRRTCTVTVKLWGNNHSLNYGEEIEREKDDTVTSKDWERIVTEFSKGVLSRAVALYRRVNHG